MGERLAFYQAACDSLQEASKYLTNKQVSKLLINYWNYQISLRFVVLNGGEIAHLWVPIMHDFSIVFTLMQDFIIGN